MAAKICVAIASPVSKTLCPADSEMVCLRELHQRPTHAEKFSGDCNSVAELILCRFQLWDELRADYKRLYCCTHHVQEVQSYKPGQVRSGGKLVFACAMEKFDQIPDIETDKNPGDHSTRSRAAESYRAFMDGCEALWKAHQLNLPVGAPLCRYDHTFLKEYAPKALEYTITHTKFHALRVTPAHESLQPRPTSGQDASSDSSQSQPMKQSQEYKPRQESIPKFETPEQKRAKDHLKKFTDEMGLSLGDGIYPNLPFGSLAASTQNRKANEYRRIDQAIRQLLAPDCPELLKSLALQKDRDSQFSFFGQTTKLDDLMNNIVQMFTTARSADERIQVLGLVASVLTKNELCKYITISDNMFTRARIAAQQYKPGAFRTIAKRKRMKYDPQLVTHFIAFLISPHISTDMPYGSTTMTMDKGGKLTCERLCRIMVQERIVAQYLRYCQEMNITRHLHRSTLIAILKACPADTRKAMQGLDYITQDGSEAFDDLISLCDELQKRGKQTSEWSKDTTQMLKRCKYYFKSDFKTHIHKTDPTSDHCCNFSLSDPTNPAFRSICGPECHEHKLQCFDCNYVEMVMDEIEQVMSEITLDDKMLQDQLAYRLERSLKNLRKWKTHMVRLVNQDRCRDEIMESMDIGDCHITMDFAMKFLPVKNRQRQKDWYGLKGLSWHVTCVHHKWNATEIESRTYVHVLKNEKQDSVSVVAILKDVLLRLKSERPDIKRAFVRSDNARAYHGNFTLTSIPAISKEANIEIARFDFVECQGGKGVCDRYSAAVKRHLRLWIDEGNDVETVEQFVHGCGSHGGIDGVTVICGTVIQPKLSTGATIHRVKDKHNFSYDNKNQEVRSWLNYDIGSGHVMSTSKFPTTAPTFITELVDQATSAKRNELKSLWYKDGSDQHENGSADDVRRRLEQSESKRPKTEDEQEDDFVQRALFPCGYDGCVKVFRNYKNYLKHNDSGKHEIQPERESLLDCARLMYKEQSESLAIQIPSLATAVQDFDEAYRRKSPIKMGWAIKEESISKPFNKNQTDYLSDWFRQGELDPSKKADAHMVATDMKTAKLSNGQPRFGKEEYLEWLQIAGWFSRHLQKVRQTVASTSAVHDDVSEQPADTEENPDLFETYIANREFSQFDNLVTAAKDSGEFDHTPISGVPGQTFKSPDPKKGMQMKK